MTFPINTETARHGRRLFLFGGVGVANTATDFLAFAALVALGLAPALANVLAFLLANAQSYLVNSRITFRTEDGPSALSPFGYGRFLAVHVVSLVISTAMIVAFAGVTGPLKAKAAATVFTFLWNYTVSALVVFRQPRERAS